MMTSLQEHEMMWTRADAILEQSQNPNTKFFALQVMDGVIKYRWNALPDDQREGIKNFISNLIIKLSTDEASFRRDRAFINKINNVLVQILKHDWPARWASFVPDLVGAAKQSESLCENCMNILRLLSEEVFDFSRGELTQAKIMELKNALNTDFPSIHELCEFVLQHSQKPELIQQHAADAARVPELDPAGVHLREHAAGHAAEALARPELPQRRAAVPRRDRGPLAVEQKYDQHFIKLYVTVITQLQQILPRSVKIAEAYANGSDDEQAYIQNLAIFLTQFFKHHIEFAGADAGEPGSTCWWA